MAKRFTDSEKWRDEWFGSLSNDYRIVWLYLVDNCSHAGIWKKDFRGLNFNCNTSLSEDQFKEIFAGRVVDCGNFFFIPKFIKFQYPKGLDSKKPAIVSVANELQKNNLLPIIKKQLGNDYLIIKDKDKVKDKDTVKDERKEKETPKPKNFSALAFELIPDNFNGDEFSILWDDYERLRIKKKKPLTETAVKQRINNLIKLSGGNWTKAKAIMEYSIGGGWDDFYEPKQTESTTTIQSRYAHESQEIKRDRA